MRQGVWAMAALLALAAGVRADEEAAVKTVEKFGGKVTRDEKAPGRPVVAVDFNRSSVTDAGLKELKDLKQLRSIDLCHTKVTDEGLKELKELNQLRGLLLRDTKITEAHEPRLVGMA